ncbi:MAG: DNA translocase FtsK [Anaerolineales bacterium]|nr:DNA translocase FtsK [Anaerolineales bacterium]
MSKEQELIGTINRQFEQFNQAVANVEYLQTLCLEQAKQEHARLRKEAQQVNQEKTAQIESAYKQTTQRLAAERDDLVAVHGFAALSWGDESKWKRWQPPTNLLEFGMVRIGEVLVPGKNKFALPALIPLLGSQALLLGADGQAKEAASRAVQGFLLRLLAIIPPGKLRFTFIDPVGLGQNAAAFMQLADHDDLLVTYKSWSETAHIEKQLADFTEHMETVIQKYLRNQYASIEQYNHEAGEVAEPYRLLVIFDFPTNISESAARRLVSIAQNGPRCGVYPLVIVDRAKPLPYGFALADLERHATCIVHNGDHFVWDSPGFREYPLVLEKPPKKELFNQIVNRVGEAAQDASRVVVPFDKITPSKNDWWQTDASEGLNVPLGPAGARKHQYLDLGKGTAHHVLVAGKTGSGKSTLLHVLITNLALYYSPDEVELYLIDFKKGVEFKAYTGQNGDKPLPHARVIAVESEREFGLSVLQGLDAELKQRGDLFRKQGVNNLAEYRKSNGMKMPRILLVVDEFQEFFTEDDNLAAHTGQILDRLVRQGRSFGMHVLLGSQTLAGVYSLSRSTIDQMAVRVALQCSEADSRLILADDNIAARRLSRAGEAIYNDANGLVEGNSPFQVAWLSDDLRNHYLQEIQQLAQENEYYQTNQTIIFEGNTPANIDNNQLLRTLINAPDRPQIQRYTEAWLGDPIAIKPPTAVRFRKQSGSNLLILGQNDEMGVSMMFNAVIGLAAHYARRSAKFFILDFSPVDAIYADLLPQLPDLLPHEVVWQRRRRDVAEIIAQVAAIVEQRLENEENLGEEAAIYLCIYGLQRARDLREEDDFGYSSFTDFDDGEKPASPAKQFVTILRDGPDLGVHTLAWCDTLPNFERTIGRMMREFEMRVLMQMNANDSSVVIDSPAASKLGAHRALLYVEDEGRLEKFRPYALPLEAWKQNVKRGLDKKA